MSPERFFVPKKIQRALHLGLALCALALNGCTSLQAPSSTSSAAAALEAPGSLREDRVEAEARSTFFPAEQAFLAKNFTEAARGYRAVKTRFSSRSRAHQLASYRLGTLHYYRADYPEASREFEYFLARYPQSELAFDVQYNLAATYFQLGNYDRTALLLERFTPAQISSQGTARSEVVYQLWAMNANSRGNHSSAIYALTALLQISSADGARRQNEEKLDYHLQKLSSATELSSLLEEIKEPYFQTRGAARLLALQNPGSPQESIAPQMVSDQARTELASVKSGPVGLPLGGNSRGDKQHIGVVLPLTGKWASYGKQALDGITLAAKAFHASRANEFKLFIEDSGSNPVIAEGAVERLVQKHDVMAIIGPLNWKESLAVAEKAQSLGVLNLSLSSREGISGQGAYLFQNALTPRTQMENLATHAVTQRGWKRFAILHPANPFGRDMANEFWSAVEKLGGVVVGFVSYDPNENDFQKSVQKLVGTDSPKWRRLESAKLAEFIKEQKAKTGKEPKAQLPPIIDFDALFIPDGPKTVTQIAASLAYYDVKGVPLLGTSEWNSDVLLKRGGKLVDGALFPAGLSLSARSESQRVFLREYSDAYGAPPDLLAAQAYEAMQLVSQAIQLAGSGSRNDVVAELSQLKEMQTALGSLSFDATRVARRRLPIMGVDGQQIVER